MHRYFAMKYLQQKGYRVLPVNPMAAGQTILGEKVFASIAELGNLDTELAETVDMVDIFRRPEGVCGNSTDPPTTNLHVRVYVAHLLA
jgi:predicted CoA-binding protein